MSLPIVAALGRLLRVCAGIGRISRTAGTKSREYSDFRRFTGAVNTVPIHYSIKGIRKVTMVPTL